MGLTIHHGKGKAESREKIDELFKSLTNIAKIAKWEYWTDKKDEDWRGEKMNYYAFLTNIDEGCETFEIAFNLDTLELQRGFCKTQYSKDFIKTHHTVCQLLQMIKDDYIKDIEVSDEGDYFGNWDKTKLGAEGKKWDKMIEDVGNLLKKTFKDNNNIEIIEKPLIKNGEIYRKHKLKITIESKENLDTVIKQIEQTLDKEVKTEYMKSVKVEKL